jgi:hypothetical protein
VDGELFRALVVAHFSSTSKLNTARNPVALLSQTGAQANVIVGLFPFSGSKIEVIAQIAGAWRRTL